MRVEPKGQSIGPQQTTEIGWTHLHRGTGAVARLMLQFQVLTVVPVEREDAVITSKNRGGNSTVILLGDACVALVPRLSLIHI